MASTDTRSGFRLPWSSDRSQDPAAEVAADTEAVTDAESEAVAADPAWPKSDFNAALGLTRTQEQRPLEATHTPSDENEEPSPMVDMETAVAPAPTVAPKKSSRMMVDLSAAIRATAETAHTQTLEQVHTDSAQVVEAIRASSTDGVTTLKQQSEDDIAAIRDWSKAEIARIKDETDAKITTRKATLEDELAGHAAAVDRRVDEVHAEVTRFEGALAAYRERLEREDDPAQLATMAEELPELPSFAAWADLGTLDITAPADEAEPEAPQPEPEAPQAELEVPQAEADTETVDETAELLDAEAVAERIGEVAAPADDWYAPTEDAPASEDAGTGSEPAENAWGESPELQPNSTEATTDDAGDVPRWAAGEVPDGFPTGEGEEAGDPVDRGAIMAALEAAAEAVVAAEAAADSAETAEAAADVAETAAELLVGRQADELDYDPEAAAAMAARVDAGGYETETFSERLANLMPGHGEGEAGDEPRTTQVVVSGLVSVASIASFKRHLGRLPGVQAVAVASGPEGEFVFNVTHRADLSFRDVIPTMPGFAARVTGAGDGTLQVAARDPEAEG